MRSLIKTADRLYALFLKVANSLQSPLLLAIRVYWGWQFWQSGSGKLSDISKTVDYFTSLGVPAPSLNAHFIAWLEAVGGILLILGLASRLIALPLLIDMIMAYVIADREALSSIISDPDKFYAAAPYTLLFASLIILAFGPGMFSLDTLIKRYRAKAKTESAPAT
ncbi:MAG TPA: DoxX family protein [Candidatus Angelobacter sp.]|nr:DoxX family protein [Candidatus Angelobacter sp.]